MFLAGFLAAYAAVIELYVGPVSAILGLYLLVQCVRRQRRPDDLLLFGVGAAIPTVILLGYNQLAFGSPWEMGYFHHATREFAQVHNAKNPLGLAVPDSFWGRLLSLLWGRYRGLTFFAPILLLTAPGWVALLALRRYSVAAISFLVVLAVLLVNVFYPEWTGGWSTGPRLLVPLLPFAMLPVAALLSGDSTLSKVATWLTLALALAGGVEMLLFQGAGGRVPHDIADPLVQAVWPLWSGGPVPSWRFGQRFCRNLTVLAAPRSIAGLSPRWQTIQFLPLLLAQGIGMLGLWRFGRDVQSHLAHRDNPTRAPGEPRPTGQPSDLGIDQQQEGRRDCEQHQNSEHQTQRARPDARP